MKKLENIELEMPSITKINDLDRKIQGNLNRLESSMRKIVKTLETIKFHNLESSRIDRIEEVINTLGTTFSSIKIRKEETSAKEEPKFVYVPNEGVTCSSSTQHQSKPKYSQTSWSSRQRSKHLPPQICPTHGRCSSTGSNRKQGAGAGVV